MALLDCRTNLVGEQQGIGFLALENRIATLNIGLDVPRSDLLEHSHEFVHRQNIAPADVQPPKERNISLHLVADLCSCMSQRAYGYNRWPTRLNSAKLQDEKRPNVLTGFWQ